MTTFQELRIVRLPLAAPVAAAGIRTAAVIGVGIATLSAFIGAGGLGDFINRGLALSDARLILLGAIPAGVLALVVDGSIAGLEWAADTRRHRDGGRGRGLARAFAVAFAAVLVVVPVALYTWGASGFGVRSSAAEGAADEGAVGSARSVPVRVCSKNFTEQLVLGEIVAQVLESAGVPVDRRLNLGGTMICHGALVRGEVDVYVEYTGTALTAVLGRSVVSGDPDQVYEDVSEAYEARFGVRWLPPLGFDNTYVLLTDRARADREGWRAASHVAPQSERLAAGMTAEFAERPDGYQGFTDHYGYTFGTTRDLDPGIVYQALARGEVDVAFGFATDGRIVQHDLAVLDDDRGYFPPYEAAPVVREAALARDPTIATALRNLAGQLPDTVMRRLNQEVDADGRPVPDVARDFLHSRGLVEDSDRGGDRR
jgi:osmoprotectant transport system permease protein